MILYLKFKEKTLVKNILINIYIYLIGNKYIN